METENLKLIGGGAAFTVVLGAFVWLIRTVGVALVAEIRALRGEVQSLRESIADLKGTVEGLVLERERTPVGVDPPRPPRARTAPEGVPVAAIGGYGPRRGGRDG
jgi:hypothetical protein